MTLETESRIPTMLALAFLALACAACAGPQSAETEAAADAPEAETAPSLEDVGEEIADVGESAGAYAFHQKEEFEAWGRARLEAIDAELERLQTELAASDDAVREQWESSVEEMREMREDLDTRLEAAATSTEDAWIELRTGFSEAQATLLDSLEEAWGELTSGDDERAAT